MGWSGCAGSSRVSEEEVPPNPVPVSPNQPYALIAWELPPAGA